MFILFILIKPWPEDALQAVASKALEDVDLSPEELFGCIDSCKYFHVSTQNLSQRFLAQLDRHNYVTPTSYLELISTFKTLLDKKRRLFKFKFYFLSLNKN